MDLHIKLASASTRAATKTKSTKKAMEDVPKRRTSFAHAMLAAGMNGMESTVHLLENELYVASLEKERLPSVSHSLVGLLLRLLGPQAECRR